MKETNFSLEAENRAEAKKTDSMVRGAIKSHAVNLLQFAAGLLLFGGGLALYFTQINSLLQAMGLAAMAAGFVLAYFSFEH